MKIIGFASQLAMGKDTAADYLAKRLNENKNLGNWTRCGFADAVKKTFCDAFGVDRDFLEKWKRINEPPENMLMPVRQALQFIGDGFRKIKPEIWIEIALRDTSKQLILSDVRYHNEARNIRQREGINVIMYRPDFINDDPNPSESQLKPLILWCLKNQKDGVIDHKAPDAPEGHQYYDFFLKNDGEIEKLYKKIDDILIPYLETIYA